MPPNLICIIPYLATEKKIVISQEIGQETLAAPFLFVSASAQFDGITRKMGRMISGAVLGEQISLQSL